MITIIVLFFFVVISFEGWMIIRLLDINKESLKKQALNQYRKEFEGETINSLLTEIRNRTYRLPDPTTRIDFLDILTELRVVKSRGG